jgi:hypothetical protein
MRQTIKKLLPILLMMRLNIADEAEKPGHHQERFTAAC